jgi:hypothetical protein
MEKLPPRESCKTVTDTLEAAKLWMSDPKHVVKFGRQFSVNSQGVECEPHYACRTCLMGAIRLFAGSYLTGDSAIAVLERAARDLSISLMNMVNYGYGDTPMSALDIARVYNRALALHKENLVMA